MKKHFLLTCYLLCLVAGMANAQNAIASEDKDISPQKGKQVNLIHNGFYENKGQITDQNYKPNPEVKYLLSTPRFNVQLRQAGFSYDTYTDSVVSVPSPLGSSKMKLGKGEEQPNMIIRNWHRVDVELLGCNPNAELIPEGKSTEYYNYFTAGTPQGGVSNVHYYSTVLYKDIYPHIDLEFMVSDGKNPVEYNFIIHAGGNVADIKLSYQGANKVNLTNNALVVSVTAGDFTENIPSGYIKDTKQPIPINYRESGKNTYGFSLGSSPIPLYSDIVIDPAPYLVWGTYYGGVDEDYNTGITLDDSDNVYITGYTMGNSGMASKGAYLTTGDGIQGDVFVAKFNSTGSKLIWGTYYGGRGTDFSEGIQIDHTHNIYITGETASASGIATPGAYQTMGDSIDGNAFVAEFNSTGTKLLWGTYYGTSQTESTDIVLDDSNNTYITGRTFGNSGIATPGAYQTVYGTHVDAFVAKFNPTGSKLVWGTYYGGTGNDVGSSLILDDSNNIYVIGYTESTSAIATLGAYQTTYGGGGADAFVAKFNPTGSKLLWGTYYGGADNDFGYGIAKDDSNNIYVVGGTASTTAIATPGAYQTTYGGGISDAFISRFNSKGSKLVWGTYYGGTGFEDGLAIAIDDSDNTYITGRTGSTSGIATPGAYQTFFGGGGFDAFVAKFNPVGSKLLWGTYYGGRGTDACEGISVDSAANIFIEGQAMSESGMATPGVYQTTCDTIEGDALIAEFSNNPAPITIFTGDVTNPLCNGGTGSASIASWGGVSSYTYSWTPSGGTNATGTGLSAGIYTITVTDKANKSATASVTITQPTLLTAAMGIPINPLCNGRLGNVTVTAGGGTSPYGYSWAPSGGTSAIGTGLTAGNYTVTVKDANDCSATANVSITQPAALTATMGTPTHILCNGGTGSATATISGGTSPYTYSWAPSGGTNAMGTGLTAGSYTVTITDINSCTLIDSVTITQPAVLTATMGALTNPPCNGGTGSATVSANGGISPYSYLWAPSGGTNATGTGLTAGLYNVTITDLNSCTATASATITQPIVLTATMGIPANILCNGGTGSATVSANGGTFPYVYSWAPSGGGNPLGTGLTAGTYTVTVRDNNDCSATASVTITQPTVMLVKRDSINVNGTCNGEASVSISGGTAPYVYNWSPGGGTNDTINEKCAGQYCCIITDNNGCQEKVCINILNTTGIDKITSNSEQITLFPNPNNGQFTLSLSHPELVLGTQTIEVYNVLGSKVYSAMLKQVQHDYEIDLSSQPSGVYLYRVVAEDGSLLGEGKLVIER